MLAYFLYGIGLGALLHTYFLYPIILIILNRLVASKEKVSDSFSEEPLPSVTLVIAAYNEEVVIDEKLRNSLSLDYPHDRFKIVIASDGSSDRTNEITLEYMKKYPIIDLLELPRGGKCQAINAAISKVDSEIIIFSDANTEYQRDALKKLVRHFKHSDIGCVCGRLIYRNQNQVLSGKGESLYWKYETMIKKLEGKLGFVAGANGAIYAVRKELVDYLPENTINDDFFISMRVVQKRKKSIYEQNAIAYEDVAPSIESEFKRHIRDGAGHYIAILQLWRLMNPLLGWPSFIFWSHRLLRWLAPFILIALFSGNIFLLNDPFFLVFFYLQTLFYTFAFLGLMIKNENLPLIIYVPFYFCILNLALFVGFFRLVFGLQKTVWVSTARKYNE